MQLHSVQDGYIKKMDDNKCEEDEEKSKFIDWWECKIICHFGKLFGSSSKS